MSVTFTVSDLFSVTTKARVYQLALNIATALGLPVTTWRAGDPTRSMYHVVAEEIETRDNTASEYAKSAFLDTATGDWLTLLADQVYNVQREEATAAAGSVVLRNTEGGAFAWDANDIVFRSSITGKTYHNTAAGSLSEVNEELTVAFIADEEGADSALGVDELDELVTALPGVEILSSTEALASDAEDDETLRERCRNSTGALSPNGPADAYRFVATSSDLTGNTETTRVSVDADSVAGTVTVYCAGESGGVSGGALTAVQNALATYATPLCITLDVQSASALPIACTVSVVLRSSTGVTEAEAEAAIEESIRAAINAYPVGGISNTFYGDAVRGACFETYGSSGTVAVTVMLPALTTAMADDDVATPGAISVSVTFL